MQCRDMDRCVAADVACSVVIVCVLGSMDKSCAKRLNQLNSHKTVFSFTVFEYSAMRA